MLPSPKPRAITAPVIIAVILLIVAAVAFFVVLLVFSPSRENEPADATLEADYAGIVEPLTAMGNASRGEVLLTTYACAACHILGGEQIAPPLIGLAAVAAERRPPLTAAEYIYESIVNPAVYLVEPYPASMPQDFASRMSEQEIADVLVYLLNNGS